MLFAAQWWKYNGKTLENKNGDWVYKKETWILSSGGQAIRNSLGSVLYADSYSGGMHLNLNTHFLYIHIYFRRKSRTKVSNQKK